MAPNVGVTVIPVVLWMLLAFLTIMDALFTRRRWVPIGQRVVTWTHRYPLFLFVLSGVIGAFLGHFFGKSITILGWTP
jgi:hypothetical protein